MPPRKRIPAPVRPASVPYVPPVEPENALTEEMLKGEMFPHCNYNVHLPWYMMEDFLSREAEVGLDLDPDYQREHRWTLEQRVAYIEYVLLGGEVGKAILSGQTSGPRGEEVVARPDGTIYVPNYGLVDGKQRMTSVRMFLRGEFLIFPGRGPRAEGYRWQDLGRSLTRSLAASFEWRRVKLASRLDLCKLYLKLNSGGTPHTREELGRVEAMVAAMEAEGRTE